jgi:hypothetical protein
MRLASRPPSTIWRPSSKDLLRGLGQATNPTEPAETIYCPRRKHVLAGGSGGLLLLGSIQGVDLDALVFVARREGAQELDRSATERHFMSEPFLRFLPRNRPHDRVELGRKCESVSSALEQRGRPAALPGRRRGIRRRRSTGASIPLALGSSTGAKHSPRVRALKSRDAL